MSERTSSGVPENAAVHRAQALTPEDIEAVLADFRSWLQQIAERAEPSNDLPLPQAPGEQLELMDLHTLLGQLVALRHEVNLQTKATRSQQEQTSEAVQQLGQAVEVLRQARAASVQEDQVTRDDRLRPLLKTLVDLHDALSLAGREVQRLREEILPSLARVTIPDEVTVPKVQPRSERSFWARWFGGGTGAAQEQTIAALQRALAAQQAWQQQTVEAARRAKDLLDSVVTGYTMSLQRLERTLQQHELEAIPCTGQPFDPELMEVVEAVSDTGRPAGVVLAEVRRGYLWRGRVFRYAQVRVSRS